MTPQELIDLPGYGSAKRELIKQGQWQATMTDTERIEWIEDNCRGIETRGNYIPVLGEFFRADLDEYATARAAILANQGTHHAPKR
jgi:hypothetical protein